ncbi:MAG: PorT family protein [Bacteroidales bacterium]|nr:PorT family protein [Bacteroidales bacterium]
MGRLNDTDFDLRIREILDSAEEEVPAHIWDAVETRLDEIDASRKRRIIPVWLRNAGFVSAAAAAVALALVLTGTFRNNAPAGQDDMFAVIESPKPQEGSMSTAGDYAGCNDMALLAENIAGTNSQVHVYESVLASADTAGAASEIQEAMEQEKTENVSRPAELPSSMSSINGNAKSDRWTDPFAFEDEAPGSRPAVSITLNGNASGSSNSGTSAAPAIRPMKAGAQRAARNTINETGSSTYSIPVSFGVGAKVSLAPRWSIGAGVNYTLLTRSFKGTYIDESKTPVEYAKIRNSQSYIGIPVNAYFSIISNSKIDFYAYAGGTAEKCVSNRYRMAPEIIYKENVKGFQFSADAGIGVEFIFADMIGLYIDPNIKYYFKDKNQPKSIRTENPLSFGCEIGLRVRL